MHLHEIVKIDAAAFIGLVCDVLKLTTAAIGRENDGT
jgi:hypothetical protein